MNNRILAIDIGSTKICAIITEIRNNEPYIIGYSKQRSRGIKKGKITNIELAAQSIKNTLNELKNIAGIEEFPKAIVSISGGYTKGFNSSAIINSLNDEISIKEVDRAIKTASYNATLPQEYTPIHILPYHFKLDDQDHIEDPVGMFGKRLEVFVYIIAAQKTSLENFKKTINLAGIEIENIVLSSYASSISTLHEEEKELGAVCIDMGGETCDMTVYLGNSMRYSNHLNVGSENITIDISSSFSTTKLAAEEIKKLIDFTQDSEFKEFEAPRLGGETSKIPKEDIDKAVRERIIETFKFLSKLFEMSGLKDQVHTLILSGGMSKLKSIDIAAKAFFRDKTVRIAKLIELNGSFDEMKEEGNANATAIGLLLYGMGKHTNYETDSRGTIRYRSNKGYNEVIHEGINHDDKIFMHTNLSNLSNNISKEEKKSEKPDIISPSKESFFERAKKKFFTIF